MMQNPAKMKALVYRPYNSFTIGNNDPSTNKLVHIIAIVIAKQVERI